jgi:hypothetical protein
MHFSGIECECLLHPIFAVASCLGSWFLLLSESELPGLLMQFRTLSLELFGTQDKHEEVRQRVVHYIKWVNQ